MKDDDPVMEMYKAQAIIIEKEAEIQQLKRENETLQRQLQLKDMESKVEYSNLRGSSSNQQDVWAAIREIREERRKDTDAIDRVENTLRDTQKMLEDIQKALEEMQKRLESVENTPRIDKLEKKVEEIAAACRKPEEVAQIFLPPDGNAPPEWETILVLGGGYNGWKSFILNRKRNRWKTLAFCHPCGSDHGGTVILNSKLYVMGGNQLLRLNSKMKWIELAPMKQHRKYITNSCLVFQGCIWVFGGRLILWNGNDGDNLKSVERYCPQANQWTYMPEMTVPRSKCTAAVCNGKIIVCGGKTRGQCELKSVECFDPTSGIWTPLPNLPAIRSDLSTSCHKDRLLVFGGSYEGWLSNTYYNTVWTINPEEPSAWVDLPSMIDTRSAFTAVSDGNEIFAIGGYGDKGYLSKVEIFNGEDWREGPELPCTCYAMPSLVIPSSLAVALKQFEILFAKL